MNRADAPSGWREPDPVDDGFSLLADRDRRAVIHYFHTSEAELATVDDLVGHVVDRTRAPTAEAREVVSIKLHHESLPKLADAGCIEYDGRSGAVRYRGAAFVTAVLEALRELDVPNESDCAAD